MTARDKNRAAAEVTDVLPGTPEWEESEIALGYKQPEEAPVHTRGGIVIGSPELPYIEYGMTHDLKCPGCADTPFTLSPRSETYWSS